MTEVLLLALEFTYISGLTELHIDIYIKNGVCEEVLLALSATNMKYF